MQVRGWCQDMCLNRARQRRRHRRAVEDWAHLYEHALAADTAPAFLDWLPASGWQWPLDSGDPQVGKARLATSPSPGADWGQLCMRKADKWSICFSTQLFQVLAAAAIMPGVQQQQALVKQPPFGILQLGASSHLPLLVNAVQAHHCTHSMPRMWSITATGRHVLMY